MDTSSGGVAAMNVLLLSGTSEGPVLARMLLEHGFRVRATVTRAEACTNLFGPLLGQMEVEARGFTEAGLTDFLGRRSGEGPAGAGPTDDRQADLVLDATHPFAVRITRLAHAVCARLGVPFIRYERPDWQPPEGTLFAGSFAEAARCLPTLGRRAVLTIGAKQLKHFAHLHDQMEMFARVLPSPVSVAQAQAAGFDTERIFGQRPPFSREQNAALFRQCRADVLLTKASGVEGGVVEKVLAAHDLGLRVLIIRRPESAGITSVGSLEAAVAACLAAREG
jgi:precorrin-6A/cobalt-precorrin-6A reductase